MWLDLLPIALLGGLLGLDVVSFPQAMISRPLVAATITVMSAVEYLNRFSSAFSERPQ